jgi:hypothetical protein
LTTSLSDGVRGRLAIDLLVLAGCLALFVVLAVQMAPFIPDDSYISFRYADHLAGGHGLRFNIDESPVEGYSNFLWIVLLAAAGSVGHNLESAGTLLGGLFGSASVAFLWWILIRRGHTRLHLAIPVALLAISAPMILYAISGMETSLFAALLLALLLCLDYALAGKSFGSAIALGVVAALAALARPEGIVAMPVVALCAIVFESRHAPERRQAIFRTIAVSALTWLVLVTIYHVWRVSYFHAFWPMPFLSKGAADRSFVDAWISNFRQFFLRQSHYYVPLVYYYVAVALPAALSAVLAWRRNQRPTLELTALLLALAYAAIYLNFVDWMPGMRYYAPLVGLFLIPFSLLGPELRVPSGLHKERVADLAYGLIGLMLALFSLSNLAALRLNSQQLQASTQESLVELGIWLRETMPPNAKLAMSDVGATPYFSRLHTIDINPESLTDRHIAENGWSDEYFFAADPDIVVITAFSLDQPDFYGVHEALYHSPRFQTAYERIGVVRNDWYQDRSYWVFARRGERPTHEQMADFPAGISKP